MGFTLVEGRNHCKLDNAYSNGSGKSSVFNGICFALTGETAQGVSNGIENIFTDPDDCWVELTFTADENEFILRRYKTPKPDLKVWINGEDHSGKGIRESSKLLSTYLPDLTSTLINSIIILGQGLPSRFTNNKPSHRKELLENLTKSDFMIQSIKDKLEKRQEDLRSLLRTKEDKLLANDSKLTVYRTQMESFKEELKEYEEFDSSEDNIEYQLTLTKGEINKVNDKINSLSDEIYAANLNADDISKELRELSANNQKMLSEALVDVEADIEELKSKIAEIKVEKKVLSAEIEKLESITDICPTCGQKIPGAVKPDTSEKKNQLHSVSNNLYVTENYLDSALEEKKSITARCNKEYTANVEELERELGVIKDSLETFKTEKDSYIQQQLELNQKIAKLNNLKDNYNKLLSNINSTQESISNLETNSSEVSSEIVDIKSHLDVVQQMVTLAKREFRGILLINVIDYINKRIKQYSRQVFDTEELNFSLNENEVDISYCGKPYENLSGGEKQKIDVIIQLALRDILSKQLNIRSNLLVCDEIFDNMDLMGCNKIIDLISSLSDIDSVFIISHHAQDLELTKDNSLVVEKAENGISQIKFV